MRITRKKIKIGVFTSTRAEYGLLRWIIKSLQNLFETYVFVGGTHLLPEEGHTIEEIKKDNIKHILKLPFLGSLKTPSALTNAIGSGLIQASQIFNQIDLQFVIVLGDRYELFIPTVVSMMFGVPIIHISGGEKTEGVIDEQVRHAVTKMAHVHMPSIELYAENISRIGEEDWRIHVVGAPGLENIKRLEFYSKEEILKLTNVDVNKPTIICTYHPVTLEGEESVSWQVANLLEALSKFDLQIVFTRPNAEVGSDKVVYMIKKFVSQNKKAYFFNSLGSKLYLSFLKYIKAIIGNSSSGIIEAPSFHVPTVNIGNRQQGRFKPVNVIQTGYSTSDIMRGLTRALYDRDFLIKVKNSENPYGDGNTSSYVVKAMEKLVNIPKDKLLKKKLDFEVKKNEWHRYF